MDKKTVAKDAEDSSNGLNNLLLLMGVGLVLFLYTKVLQNRHYWIVLESAFGVFCALMFPFADVWGPHVIKQSDAMTSYMIRLLLLTIIARAAAVYYTEQSSDRTVSIAVSICNLLARGPIVLVLILCAYSDKFFAKTKQTLYADLAWCMLLTLGDVYYLVNSKTRNYSHRTVGDPVSFHLSVDGLATFFLGSLMLGFPDMFFSVISPSFRIRPIHSYYAKVFGISLLGGSISSFASLCYRDDEDAVTTLKTKLAIYLPAILLTLTNIIIDQHFRTYGHAAVMIGVMGGLTLNAGLMVYKHEKED